ncbi:hypothetical protein IWX47DRAFT_874907 [Phyllosticta citricarpa]
MAGRVLRKVWRFALMAFQVFPSINPFRPTDASWMTLCQEIGRKKNKKGKVNPTFKPKAPYHLLLFHITTPQQIDALPLPTIFTSKKQQQSGSKGGALIGMPKRRGEGQKEITMGSNRDSNAGPLAC